MTTGGSEHLLRLLEEEPEDWNIRIRLCEALIAEGRSGEAIGVLESVEIPEEYEEFVLEAADIYGQINPLRAVDLLTKFLAGHPHSAVAHLAMVDASLKLDEPGRAREYYERAIELNPEYRDVALEGKLGMAKPVSEGEASLDRNATEVLPAPVEKADELAPERRPRGRRRTGGVGSWNLMVAVVSGLAVFVLGWLGVVFVLWAMLASGR